MDEIFAVYGIPDDIEETNIIYAVCKTRQVANKYLQQARDEQGEDYNFNILKWRILDE